jgi:hypothetical protein
VAFGENPHRLKTAEIIRDSLCRWSMAEIDAGFDVAPLGGVGEMSARHESPGSVDHDALGMQAGPLVASQE